MFQKAIPVWIKEEDPRNTHLIFRAVATVKKQGVLKIAAADFYKLYLNGKMAGFGPARTAKGYARVDEYPLTADTYEIYIEVAGYGCKSLSTVRQNAFLAAELTEGELPLLYTGRDFSCFINGRREKRVERYSVQRHYNEVYHEGYYANTPVTAVPASVDIQFIPRRVPFADLSVKTLGGFVARGTFTPAETFNGRVNAYSFSMDEEVDWGYFTEEEIPHKPYRWVGEQQLARTGDAGALPVELSAGEWVRFDFSQIEVGFLQLAAFAEEDTELVLFFREYCPNEDLQSRTMNAQTVLQYNIKAGTAIDVESFEPYSFRHATVLIKKGRVQLRSFGFRNFARELSDLIPRSFRDPELQSIYEGAVRTFAHNGVDLFTDCPSRERAGWLCDSYFTGRAEYFLFGKTPIEDAFLENYTLYKNDGNIPNGVLPMCYPADAHGPQPDGYFMFIPQWNLWYVLEVCEHLTLRNPNKDKEFFRPSVMGIMNFFKGYENELELLEKLPSWNFVEWSKANNWTQDVNYPTNFLYAQTLEEVGKLYGIPAYSEKAARIRKKVIELAFDGEVFVDNALRNEQGWLENTKNVSEAGQYYAALFGGFDLNDPQFAKLKTNITDTFADFIRRNEIYDFGPADAFIGLYLRMNVLMDLGDPQLMAKNLKDFFGGMCALTGTLWEYKTPSKSLDHGFASYAALALPLADSQ